MNVETPESAARRIAAKELKNGFELKAIHEYRDSTGQIVFRRVRLGHPDGRKWIRPMTLKGTRYKPGEPSAPAGGKLLYRLPELLAADPDEDVWVVEGEGCVDTLAALGLKATTSGSASSANGADWTPLRGRKVVIWPDHDDPGLQYAHAVITRLLSLDCDIREIAPEVTQSLPKNGDCVDWLVAHPAATAEDVTRLPTVSHPAFDRRDDRDDRDLNQDMGFDIPEMAGQRAPSRDIRRFGSYFDLAEKPKPGYPKPGVYWHELKRGTTAEADALFESPAWVCGTLKVLAQTRDANCGEWGRLLSFLDNDGNEHLWACPQSMHAGRGDELRSRLLSQGLVMSSTSKLRDKISDYIQQSTVTARARSVIQTGWHGKVFVLPHQTFGDSDDERVLFQSPTIDSVAISQAGTLEGWIEFVSKPCIGNSRLILSLSSAFAGPCLDLLDAEGGGIHLRGPSSCGKSTALELAASVFGSPKRYARNWRTTDNALEGIAAMHSDLLLVLDEIGQLDPKHAGDVAYMLANGQGKIRSDRSGAPRSVATWRLLFLSSGEISLADLVTQAGSRVRAGQEVRIIDLPAECTFGIFDCVPELGDPAAFADKLRAAAATHYGHALPALLARLVRDPDKVREVLLAHRDRISNQIMTGECSGQVRRVANRFALIAAAGELATEFQLTGWGQEEATRAARDCFNAWLEARGTTGNAEEAAMLAQVRDFFQRHGESRFSPWLKDQQPSRTQNRAGFKKEVKQVGTAEFGLTYFVYREVFRNEICSGFDHRAVARLLAGTEALSPGPRGEMTRNERTPEGKARMYVIKPALLEDRQRLGTRSNH